MIAKSASAVIGAFGLVFMATTGPVLAAPASSNVLSTPGVTQGFVSVAQLEESGTAIDHRRRFKTNSP